MKVLRYILPLVLLIARLSATITPTADVYGPQQPASLTATFTSGLAFQQSSDLIIVDAGQAAALRYPATVLVLGSDYTVSGGGYNSANQMQLGTFTLTNTGGAGIILGDNIYVLRNVPANQLTVFANGGYLTAAMIEQALDKQATLSQMAFNTGNASLRVEAYETTNSVPPQLVMTKNARAGKLLGFDANGNVSFTTSSGGGATGIQSVSGTTNQVIAVTTSNAVTLSTPQNIDTTASVQFAGVNIGVASASNIAVNVQPNLTPTSNLIKAVRISPTMSVSASNDSLYSLILGGNINASSTASNTTFSEITLGTPSVGGTGSFTNSYMLYINQAPTATNHYGIYQTGTDTNQLNNLKLTPSGGGGITFADGTVQITAGGGGGGGGISSVTGTTNQITAVTTSNAVVLSTPQNIDTSATPQFGGLNVGVAAAAGIGINLQPTVITTSQLAKGVRIAPALTTAENNDSLYSLVFGGNISNAGAYTTASYAEALFGSPGVTGTFATGYQIYLSGFSSGTFGSKYGIYQAGTEANVFGGAVTVPAFTATGTTTLATSLSGLLKATSGVVSVAASGSDYAPPTSGTSLLYGNGSGGFSNATVNSTNLSFTSGTLNTIQNINSTASPQFFSVGLGSGAGPAFGALSILGTYNGSSLFSTSPFGIADTPTLAPAANSETMIALNVSPTLSPASYTSLSYTGLNLGTPSGGGSGVSTAYQIYIAAAPTATTKYGIYQAGSDTNVLNNLTLGSLSGILKGTSGVISTATSGTDYAPATSGTSILYGNGSGGFSNVTIGSGLSFTSGILSASGSSGVTSIAGTTNQVIASASTGAVTLSLPQSIATTSSPQFSSLGVGVAASGTAGDLYVNSTFEVGTSLTSGVGVNLQPSVTASSGLSKGVRITPALTAAANNDALYSAIMGGNVTNSSYTNVTYSELTLGAPGVTGSYTIGSQLQLSGLSSGTFTTKYGIYQTGTELNYFAGALSVATGSRGATNQNLTPTTTTVSASNIDWSASNSFYKTLAANTTFTFSNAVDGQVITICLLNTTSNYTVTWPTIKWAGGTAPTMTTGAHYDVYTIYYNATVGAYFGSYVQNF
jgi:hypothetical protein